MTPDQQITRIPGAKITLPPRGWEGCPQDLGIADINLLNRLRELARRSTSDPGCPPELEKHITLREVPAAALRAEVARSERVPGWRLAGEQSQDIYDRLDEHFAIPQRRGRGELAAA
jgi:hypothetical protein